MIMLDNEVDELVLDQAPELIPEDPPRPESVNSHDSLGRISLSDYPATAWPWPDYQLSIAGVYQDAATRAWAAQVASYATQLAGEHSVQSSWWMIRDLSDPQPLMDAVQAAITADLLIVSVRAADKMPFDLHEWIELWLPHRFQSSGALIALIGTPEKPGSDSFQFRRYLQEVACRADLEFLPQEQELPWEPPGFSTAEIGGRVSTRIQMFSEPISFDHWGLNE